MNQDFELRNSMWRNAVLFVLCLGFALPIFLLQIWHIWYGLILFGGGAIMFGYKTFDRRVKVVINEHGIQDFRSRKSNMDWCPGGTFVRSNSPK